MSDIKMKRYSQQVSDFLKSIYVTLLCHAKCTADFQEYYQPFHVKLTITHVAHFSAGQVYNPFSSSQKSASLQVCKSASLQSASVAHRYAMRTCISTIMQERRQHTLCERRTFAVCLRSFWVSLWILESKVRDRVGFFHFLRFVMNFLKGVVSVCQPGLIPLLHSL